MMLWLILTLMTAVAVLAVCWPFAPRQALVRSGSDVAVYRDQLEEIDRDETAGLIGKVEAEAARVEVSRRLIAAAEEAKAASPAVPARSYRLATLAVAVMLLPLGAGAVYVALGSPHLAQLSMMSADAGRQARPQGIEHAVAEAEAYLEKSPDDGRAWELLAQVYIRLGRFDEAVNARRKALAIFGPDAARLGDLGEAIFMASGGVVTPEAKDLFLRAEAIDGQDVMAQYYLGVSARQEGHSDEAEKRWRALIAAAPEGAEYVPMIRRALAQIDPSVAAAAAAPPAPASTIAAPPDHKAGAIDAMVERLAGRLKQDGSDVMGWIQLVRSYRVLGKAAKADAAIADARAALASDPERLQRLEQNLQELQGGTGPNAAPAAAGPASGQSAIQAGIAPPGPNASQIADAAQMAPAERNGMIEGMVARLAQRLSANGSDVDGWLRLIRAYSVLGERDKALAAASDARRALAGHDDNLRRIGELMKELGLDG